MLKRVVLGLGLGLEKQEKVKGITKRLMAILDISPMLASFPGSLRAQDKNFCTASDGKLGGAWEQGYYNVVTRTHIPSPSSLGTKAVICKLADYIAHIHTFSLLLGDRKALQGLCDM